MITVKQYTKDKFDQWNKFVDQANNGTIFHRLDFLAYHGNKFEMNEHHLMFYKGEHLVGVMPMGIFKDNERIVAKSPYGASWGGLVFSDKLSIKYVIGITNSMLEYLTQQKVNECVITVPPQCYYLNYTNYFEFSLFTNGFSVVNRENHLIVNLPEREEDIMNLYDSKCRNQTKKGQSIFKTIYEHVPVDEYYPILMEDKVRHQSLPTHTKEDMDYFAEKFPDNIYFDVGVNDNGHKVGICYFTCNQKTTMTFYMSQQNEAVGMNGTNALVYSGMKSAMKRGLKVFDFGGSSLNSRIRNMGVSEFKESFGASGVFRDTYKKTLQ